MNWIFTIGLSVYLVCSVIHIMECINCNTHPRVHLELYHALDMDPDIISVIEEWRNVEVMDGDSLCQDCLQHALQELDRRNLAVDVHQIPRTDHCICCNISISRRSGRRSRLIPEGRPERVFIAEVIQPRQIPVDARVCNSCWQRAHANRQYQPVPEPVQDEQPVENDQPVPELIDNEQPVLGPVENEEAVPEPGQNEHPAPEPHDNVQPREIINLENYRRTPNTASHCFVPECANRERLRVPMYLKKKLLKEKRLYISESSRVCEFHRRLYDWDFLEQFEFTSHNFSNQNIEDMLEILKQSEDILNFESENIDDAQCNFWTGLTIIQFLTIYNCVQLHLDNMFKKPKKALALYLVKLRTGDSFARIASVFSISKTMAQSYAKKVRVCLTQFYVPLHLGLQHITREGISNRNLLIPQGIFGTEARNPIVICDGTYIYMQKSSNYLFQKKSYSLHKFRNLVKPLLFVSTDGHIIDAYGPYPATTSDADIMLSLFQEGSELRQFFQAQDIFILDRGFRDALGLLADLGYSVYKPHSLQTGENQLSTRNANESRLVTMCRWVVEVVNGRFKRDYKIFRSEYFNTMSRNLMADFKIASAIINNFHPVIIDRIDAELILIRALARRSMPNHLAEHVTTHNLNRRRVQFVTIESQIPALDMFPIMQMSDLILFCLGTYQIKQARSYYGEHIRQNGTFQVEVCDEFNITHVPGIVATEPTLIRGRIKSRHHSRTIYYTYILIDVVSNNWEESICGYYCSCIIGKRTVGSCAHVATIVWYLGWARYQENISPPAPFLDGILVREDL